MRKRRIIRFKSFRKATFIIINNWKIHQDNYKKFKRAISNYY